MSEISNKRVQTFRLASASRNPQQPEITYDERCEAVEKIIDENQMKKCVRRSRLRAAEDK